MHVSPLLNSVKAPGGFRTDEAEEEKIRTQYTTTAQDELFKSRICVANEIGLLLFRKLHSNVILRGPRMQTVIPINVRHPVASSSQPPKLGRDKVEIYPVRPPW